MNRRFIILCGPLFLCIVATLAYCLAHRQPAYDGKPLSKWLSDLALDPTVSQKAGRAIRAIGTNALPSLAVMIRASDPAWRRAVMAFNSKQHFIRIAVTTAGIIRSDAIEGYRALGGLAKGNVPVLIQLLESESSLQVREEVAVLQHPTHPAQYVSRGAVDHNGNLFFGVVGTKPVGIFKVHLPASRRKKNAHLSIRMWG